MVRMFGSYTTVATDVDDLILGDTGETVVSER